MRGVHIDDNAAVRAPRGYGARGAVIGDLSAIEHLLTACDANEPEPSYRSLFNELRAAIEEGASQPSGKALVVVGAGGQLVGCASVRLPDYPRPVARARLAGAVHPEHRRRGIGGFLLQWAECAAHDLFGTRHETRPRSLRISFGGVRDDARRLYQRHEFGIHEVTLQLRRDLGTLLLPAGQVAESPEGMMPNGSVIPAGVTIATWCPDTQALFYVVHAASHTVGPEDHLATPQEWIDDVATDTSLRSDLSFVALDGTHPCAYVLSEVVTREGRSVGWIWLLGVDPSYRRKGLAAALLTRVLTAFQREGLPEAGLWVDEANTAARTLYDRLGFRVRSHLTTYAKPVHVAPSRIPATLPL